MPDRLAFNTFAFPSLPVSTLLQEIERIGISGVGLFSAHATELLAQDDRSLRAALQFTACYVVFHAPTEQSRVGFESRLAECAALGIEALVVIPSASWVDAGGLTAFAESFDALAERAASSSVTLALEPLAPALSDVTCLHTVADAMSILSRRPAERAGLILDLTHVQPGEVFDLSEDVVRRVLSVHVADLQRPGDPSTRVLPGEGTLPLRELCAHLRRRGYERWWELELTDAPVPDDLHRFLVRGLAALENVL